MKVLAATLVTLLLLATCSPSEGHLGGVASECCFSYTRLPIPQRVVRTVHVTSRACRLPAVVLVTKKNRNMCADPRMAWVQKLVEHF